MQRLVTVIKKKAAHLAESNQELDSITIGSARICLGKNDVLDVKNEFTGSMVCIIH